MKINLNTDVELTTLVTLSDGKFIDKIALYKNEHKEYVVKGRYFTSPDVYGWCTLFASYNLKDAKHYANQFI